MIPRGGVVEDYHIESKREVDTYLARLKYALNNGATINFQRFRKVDDDCDERYTNDYTMNELFPDEDPGEVLRRELLTLTTNDYLHTVKDTRFPKRSDMREFGKVYRGKDEVYIKIRVELCAQNGLGQHTTFVMSFHFAKKPFSEETFPYRDK